MDCLYCGERATHVDLCHSRIPVCDRHVGIGHQVEAVPPEPSRPAASANGERRGRPTKGG